jgi:hypothetical protein
MSIAIPRQAQPYTGRVFDCERAVESAFLDEVKSAGTAYIDLDHVLTGIAEDATRVGWTEEEITNAVLELAKRHGLEVSAMNLRLNAIGPS